MSQALAGNNEKKLKQIQKVSNYATGRSNNEKKLKLRISFLSHVTSTCNNEKKLKRSYK